MPCGGKQGLSISPAEPVSSNAAVLILGSRASDDTPEEGAQTSPRAILTAHVRDLKRVSDA
eukprot:SAG31_NODE_16239_length_717_cov_0.982201_1_plen_60_part_01